METALPPLRYAPLGKNEIRVLRISDISRPDAISCTLLHRPRTDADYIALSYCWGDPKPVVDITVDNQRLGVAQNLGRFLQSWLTTANEVHRAKCLWIDAVCINQSDVEEKSVQVSRMWSVYENAGLVIAWLGAGSESTTTAVHTLNGIGRLAPPGQFEPGFDEVEVSTLRTWISHRLGGSAQMLVKVGGDILQLTHNVYFTRAWIFQEIINSKKLQFWYGSTWCSLDDFRTVFSRRPDHLDFLGVHSTNLSNSCEKVLGGLTVNAINKGYQHEELAWASKHLKNALGYMKDLECFDPRDKIFVMLNLPVFRAFGSSFDMQAPYSLAAEDIFILFLSYLDEFCLKASYPWDDEECADTVHRLAQILCIRIASDAFCSWLHKNTSASPEDGFIRLNLTDGRRICCSGRILHDFVHRGPIYQRVLQGPPFCYGNFANDDLFSDYSSDPESDNLN